MRMKIIYHSFIASLLFGFCAGVGAADNPETSGPDSQKKRIAVVGHSIADPEINGPVYGPMIKGQTWMGKGYLPGTPRGVESADDPIYKENTGGMNRYVQEQRAERRRNAFIGSLPGETLGSFRPKTGKKSNGRQVLYYPDNAQHGGCLHPSCPW